MARRIVVRCQSHSIPGTPVQRKDAMANLICQHEWNRNSNQDDFFTCLGRYDAENVKCYFLLDSGSVGSHTPDVTLYKWDGKRFEPKQVYPAVARYLEHIPFGGEGTGQGLSDEEYLSKYGRKEFEGMVLQRSEQEQRRRVAGDCTAKVETLQQDVETL
ncbi:hypothetical protein BDP55DRAFT_69456 [Colletotrichum godetiae]|uniref:Uncharacterized protein n=1 Tax=Colletotrichum godetiae TaxID=1209918 RepID=A0AAJ0A5B1_9PEZI|nr:uncharacterized protein BDP55DRAFT_69456 [Colletotrichum godetiae]KAK1656735.1 hypothetical protein BDP55DRAFT_69456 [Colletotrichum godetiae]